MTTYLFNWNPRRWKWDTIEEDIKELKRRGFFISNWACGKTRSIRKGDRAFLIRLGKEPRGICASGWVTSEKVEMGEHWDDNMYEQGKPALYAEVKFDVILNSETEEILTMAELKKGVLSEKCWSNQASGTIIKDHIAKKLECKWAEFILNKPYYEKYKQKFPPAKVISLAEEDIEAEYIEGNRKETITTKYERDPKARKACIKHYGLNCQICGFNFEKTYGEIGKDFIEVHHIKPLSTIEEECKVNPEKDLIPVCSNCHSIIHKKGKHYFTIEEIKSMLKHKK